MRNHLVRALALAILAAAAPFGAAPAPDAATAAAAARPDPSVARRMKASEARRRQQRRAKIVFLDTRATVDGDAIEGAYNVPVEVVEAWARRVPKSALIVAYCTCEDDGLAVDAVVALQRLGFTNAYVLEGGLDAARAAGIPMGRLAG
jgi:rhodanese-related sulfurtransferase